MRRAPVLAFMLTATAIGPSAGVLRADEIRYTARVFLDRLRPDQSLTVADLRVDAGEGRPQDSQQVELRSDEGVFLLKFGTIQEIQLLRHLGASGPRARYQARIALKDGTTRSGEVDLCVLTGTVAGAPWHVQLGTRVDRGEGLHRIVLTE